MSDLGHDGLHRAAGGHKLGTPSVQGGEKFFARNVEKRDTPQVHANDRPRVFGQRLLPAIFQLLHPGPGQPAFELEHKALRVIVNGNP